MPGLFITIRRSRTGPGLPLLLRGPLFTLSRADLSPQPPADVRICRDVVLLHRCRSVRRWRSGRATCTLAGRSQADDSNSRRSRSGNCRQRGRSAVSLGRLLARERLRLLGARLLDVQPARHRTPTQFLRVVRHGTARRTFADAARRRAHLLRPRSRRHLHRARANGACASLGHRSAGRAVGKLVVWSPDRRHPALPQALTHSSLTATEACRECAETLTYPFARFRSDL